MFDDIPPGTIITVESESETNYTGIWNTASGDYQVTLPKIICQQFYDAKRVFSVTIPRWDDHDYDEKK